MKEFFPYSNGVALAIVVAVVIVALVVASIIIYKKWKTAQLIAASHADELKKLHAAHKENEDAIQATKTLLDKSNARFKQTLAANTNIAHRVALQNVVTELQKIIKENEIGIKEEYLPEEATNSQNTMLEMSIGQLRPILAKLESTNA